MEYSFRFVTDFRCDGAGNNKCHNPIGVLVWRRTDAWWKHYFDERYLPFGIAREELPNDRSPGRRFGLGGALIRRG
jgi:hypothetical protein